MVAVGRRELLVGGVAAATVALTNASGASSQDKAVATYEALLKKIMGDAQPSEGKMVLEIPDTVESGNTVPFTVLVDSPMTEASHVKHVHIIATGNPQLDVAVFSFSLLSGKAGVTSRMRLAKSQDVVAIAALSDGRFLLRRRPVRVTIGGCGG